MQTIKYLLIIDLEATCSEDNAVPRQEMEIIEIGAVMLRIADGISVTGSVGQNNVDPMAGAGQNKVTEDSKGASQSECIGDNKDVIQAESAGVGEDVLCIQEEPFPEFQTFIKPVRHNQLTDFCKTLTSIQQSDVDQAPLYQDAIWSMASWMEGFAMVDEILFCSWGYYDKKQFQQDCIWNGVPYPFSDAHCNIKKLFATAPGQGKSVGLGKAIRKLGWKFFGTAHRGIDDARNIARIARWIIEQGIDVRPDLNK